LVLSEGLRAMSVAIKSTWQMVTTLWLDSVGRTEIPLSAVLIGSLSLVTR